MPDVIDLDGVAIEKGYCVSVDATAKKYIQVNTAIELGKKLDALSLQELPDNPNKQVIIRLANQLYREIMFFLTENYRSGLDEIESDRKAREANDERYRAGVQREINERRRVVELMRLQKLKENEELAHKKGKRLNI